MQLISKSHPNPGLTGSKRETLGAWGDVLFLVMAKVLSDILIRQTCLKSCHKLYI